MTLTKLVPAMAALALIFVSTSSYAQAESFAERAKRRSLEHEAAGLAEPYRGIMINGAMQEGLFPLRSTGVSTEPVRLAAEAFLESLGVEQRSRAEFTVDDDEWRKWMNQHSYVRQGVGFDEMSEAQRVTAFGLLRAALSAKGLKLTRDIMRLNHTLGELNDNNFVEYGEWLYWITVMGEPSADKPWGWQLDGHHAVINYFVLGDQVVMSPAFFGSEPVVAKSGKFKGVSIMQDEQNAGLAFLQSLTPEQRSAAIISTSKDGNNNVGEAFKDNLNLDYAGLRGAALDAAQQQGLLDVIRLYVGNMEDGHANIKMNEVLDHIDETWFSWIGGTDEDAVYYYRILSPVILIEFDHQRPANLRHLYPPVPNREHIHAVIRTPNGNDYGKDLLRQHYEQHEH
jgi:hypothetical protein